MTDRLRASLVATAVACAAAATATATVVHIGPARADSAEGVACPTLNPDRYVSAPNEPVAIGIASSRSDTFTTVTITRTSPAPTKVVVDRGQYRNFGPYLSVSQNTRFVASESSGSPHCAELPFKIDVQPRLTIKAMRSASRRYTFGGRVTPGRGQHVTLYRTNSGGTGQRVITAEAVVGMDGTWSLVRRFTGSGRFGFVASVTASATNLAGDSPVRPTDIY